MVQEGTLRPARRVPHVVGPQFGHRSGVIMTFGTRSAFAASAGLLATPEAGRPSWHRLPRTRWRLRGETVLRGAGQTRRFNAPTLPSPGAAPGSPPAPGAARGRARPPGTHGRRSR